MANNRKPQNSQGKIEAAKRAFDSAMTLVHNYQRLLDPSDVQGAEELGSLLTFSDTSDLDPIFAMRVQMSAKITLARVNDTAGRVEDKIRGWQSGKYAVPFVRTDACKNASAYLLMKPTSSVYAEVKDWLDKAKSILEQLNAPWGYYTCTGHGSERKRRFPYKPEHGDWKAPFEKCSFCHKQEQGKLNDRPAEVPWYEQPVKRKVSKPGSAGKRGQGKSSKSKGEQPEGKQSKPPTKGRQKRQPVYVQE